VEQPAVDVASPLQEELNSITGSSDAATESHSGDKRRSDVPDTVSDSQAKKRSKLPQPSTVEGTQDTELELLQANMKELGVGGVFLKEWEDLLQEDAEVPEALTSQCLKLYELEKDRVMNITLFDADFHVEGLTETGILKSETLCRACTKEEVVKLLEDYESLESTPPVQMFCFPFCSWVSQHVLHTVLFR
jgi:hypothetical protein